MRIKERLNKIRAEKNTSLSVKQVIFKILILFLSGVLLGFIAKYSDTIPSNGLFSTVWNTIKDVSTNLGIWILFATLIAVWSDTPRVAAIKVLAFFLGMLLAYYLYSAKLFGFFPSYYFTRWGLIALGSPFAAYVVWFGRGEGFVAALCIALPIGILIEQGYSFIYTFSTVQGFDLLAAAVLLCNIQKLKKQYLKVGFLVLAIVIIFHKFDSLDVMIGYII